MTGGGAERDTEAEVAGMRGCRFNKGTSKVIGF